MVPTRAWATLLFLLTAVAVAGCDGGHGRYLNHLERGKQYLAQNNLPKAGVEFRNALQIQPRDAQAAYLSGRVEELRGNLADALALYQASLDSSPEFDPARASLAKILVLGGQAPRALETVGPGLIRHPDSPELLAASAAAHHQLKDEPAAMADALRAVEIAPSNEDAIAVLAGLHQAAGDYSQALAVATAGAQKVPNSVDLRQILASLYFATGDTEKAEEQLRRIIELRPQELPPRLRLAIRLAQAHRLDEAQQILEVAVAALPKEPAAKLALVDFLATQRSRGDGERRLRGFIALEPGNAELMFGLGALLQRFGAAPEAIATYQEIIRHGGTDANGLLARDRIAALNIEAGQTEAAEKLAAEVLKVNPRDSDALLIHANLALDRNDPTAAIVDLRSVARDQPKLVSVYRMLARAHLAKGETALAEEALRAGVAAAPEDVSGNIELAQFLAQTDRIAQAVTLLEESVRRSPESSRAREALVRALLAKGDLAAARAAAEDLKRLIPQSSLGYFLAGTVAQDDKRWDDAASNLERAFELESTIANLTALARLEIARGRPAAAIAMVKGVAARDAPNVERLELLGDLYLSLNDTARAAQTLTQARELDPKRWMLYRDLALVRIAQNDPAAAIAECEAGVRLAPGEPQLAQQLAALYEKAGRIDEAIARYETLYRANARERQFAANNLAMLLVTYKNDKASLERARELTAGFASSQDAALLDTHGWVRFKRREYQDALTTLERAAERAPESRVIRYHLGMAELQLGQRDRARTALEFAVSGRASFAGSAEARTALAGLGAGSG